MSEKETIERARRDAPTHRGQPVGVGEEGVAYEGAGSEAGGGEKGGEDAEAAELTWAVTTRDGGSTV